MMGFFSKQTKRLEYKRKKLQVWKYANDFSLICPHFKSMYMRAIERNAKQCKENGDATCDKYFCKAYEIQNTKETHVQCPCDRAD